MFRNDSLLEVVSKRSNELGARLSQPTLDAIWDYCLGICDFADNGDPFERFRFWLAVELGVARPSLIRGGMWVGAESSSWRTLILKSTNDQHLGYLKFFELIKVYENCSFDIVFFADIKSGHPVSFLIREYNGEIPCRLDIREDSRHGGVFLESYYLSGVRQVIGYYSFEAKAMEHAKEIAGLMEWRTP